MKDNKKDWLNKKNTIDEYVHPEYYNILLKNYSFNKKNDLDYLKEFSVELNPEKILELGSGTGRASCVVTALHPNASFVFSDLSKRMLDYHKAKTDLMKKRFVVSDSIDFMNNTAEVFDYVYSLWSFSHSVHQHINNLGIVKAESEIIKTINKFISENIKKDGHFFLIHFDSMSEEQEVLMRQWNRVYKTFSDISTQSPSKRIIDKALLQNDYEGKIFLTIEHLEGDAIFYKNEEELLEIFMNFHLETYFNDSDLRDIVLEDILEQSKKYKNSAGNYIIKPGCYIYKIKKR